MQLLEYQLQGARQWVVVKTPARHCATQMHCESLQPWCLLHEMFEKLVSACTDSIWATGACPSSLHTLPTGRKLHVKKHQTAQVSKQHHQAYLRKHCSFLSLGQLWCSMFV
jgi:hypothetical protein